MIAQPAAAREVVALELVMPGRRPHARRMWCISGCSRAGVGWILLACGCWLGQSQSTFAQFSSSAPGELSASVSLDEADSAVRAHLERVRAYMADRQWDEAVEALRQVMESHGSKMIALAPRRYVNLADYCHVQIASLGDEGLALYRERVDPVAQKWYEEGISRRNAARLSEVVDKLFCSSWGDDALWALGEVELEKGHYGPARRCWERLLEVPPARVSAEKFRAVRERDGLPPADQALLDRWYVVDEDASGAFYRRVGDGILPDGDAQALVQLWRREQLEATRLAYPGAEMAPAEVRARLVLVSIMEGSLARAKDELRAFEKAYPDAQGRLAGRSGKLVESLSGLLAAAEKWPQLPPGDDWPTFAGDLRRTKVARRNLELGPAAWPPIELGDPLVADSTNSRVYSLRRIGEDNQRLLSYHPVVVDDLILVNNHRQILAFNRHTGAPAWPSTDPKRPRGEIYVDEGVPASVKGIYHALGVPRYTMTVHDRKLFARMGSQVTSRPLELAEKSGGSLVCLDLAAEGRLIWKLSPHDDKPEDDKWSFEGSPVVDGSNVYIGMRKSDVRPQGHVACFDLETRRLRWRTMVCAAETPGGGQVEEVTHNLLTLAQGTLYYNSNLGAVAAISAHDGRMQWTTLYPRARKASPGGQDLRTAHFYRDLNPCIYYRGLLLVAPADCESIFALDAGSGELVWDNHLAEDAVYLLGVGQGNLLASGDRLWWIDVERGKTLKRWPDTSPLGRGRGALMGDQVVWPTDEALYVFDQRASNMANPRDPIMLEQRGAGGGNIIDAGETLLIVASDKLYAFRQQGQAPLADKDASAKGAAQAAR